MLALSQFIKPAAASALMLGVTGAAKAELQSEDLTNSATVAAAVVKKLSSQEAKQLLFAVNMGSEVFKARRYGPAVKSWGHAALIQPNSANLVMLAESTLHEIGLGNDPAYRQKRRELAFPKLLKIYESALASEQVKPMLGKTKAQVIAHHACLKAYVEKKSLDPKCGPLIWSGAVK